MIISGGMRWACGLYRWKTSCIKFWWEALKETDHSKNLDILTYSMEQSPSWEANCFAASQEIPRTLWNPKVHHRIHKCPPSVPILSQLQSPPPPTSRRSILILSSHLRLVLPNGLIPSGFPTRTLYTPLPSPIRATSGHIWANITMSFQETWLK